MGVAYDLKQSASQLEQLQQTIEEAVRLTNSAIATGILERFLLTPGSPVWEEEFGQAWDTYYAQYLERKNELMKLSRINNNRMQPNVSLIYSSSLNKKQFLIENRFFFW
jgi:hypothetical protein